MADCMKQESQKIFPPTMDPVCMRVVQFEPGKTKSRGIRGGDDYGWIVLQ